MTAPPAMAATELPWLDTSLSAEERAELLIEAMTLEQKVQQMQILPFDESDFLEGCGFLFTGRQIEGIPELGIPTVRMTNGGTGLKGGSCEPDPLATAIPSTVAAAATFDREHNYTIGDILGQEAYAFAHQVMLAPGLNLHRLPYGGRNYEYFSEDPFLSGALGTEQVKGIQDNGVQSMIKHLAANEQETERWTMAVEVDSQTMNELYMLPFEMAAIDGDAASAMCSFPMVNGEFACENEQLLQRTLYDRWGWDGWIMSDRRALHDTVGGILAGTGVELDFEPEWYLLDLIEMYIDAGELEESDLDAVLFPRYVKMFEFGQFEDPFDEFQWDTVDLAANGERAREVAEDAIVLLKNEGGMLPLTGDEESIALIGAEWYAGMAKSAPRSGDPENENVPSEYTVTPEEGLNNVIDQLGYDTTVTHNDGTDIDAAVELAEESDLVILMAGDNPHETADRERLGFPEIAGTDQEELIPAILDANPNTVLVLKTEGMVLMPWLDQVPALLEAWYPGMEDGNAVANVLYGVVNPSGKLPVTFGNTDREAAFETEEQFPGVRVDTGLPGGPGPNGDGSDQLHSYYTEGLEMGYRWYEANDVEPVFPFGFGLSYTTFEYSDLVVTPVVNEAVGATAVTVDFTITNTGYRAGAEAGQVYLTLPDEAGQPSKRLVGFDKVFLEPGASETVSIVIDSAASNHPFSYFAPASDELSEWAEGEWVTPDGSYTIHVGPSSADVPLEQTLDLTFADTPGDEGDIPVRAEIPGGPGSEPGSLTLTIADFGEMVDLGMAKRSSDRYRWDGELPSIVVTDTRNASQAGDAGWTVSGWADDFMSETDSFSAGYLGWIPWTTADDRPGVDPGPPVDGIMRGGPGLAEPQTLVSATSEGRMGAATAGAHLSLETPLETPGGDYRSAIHLTLFPVD